MGVEVLENGRRVGYWDTPLSEAQLAQIARDKAAREAARIAPIAGEIFARAIDHAPHVHAFNYIDYSEEVVLEATAAARRYAVAQARALLDEVDAQVLGRTTP